MDTVKPLYFVLIGPQGAGKGTQAEFLQDHFGTPSISVGSLYREEVKLGSAIGKEVAHYLEQGKLVPAEITKRVLQQRLQDAAFALGVVFDGYPRNAAQADDLDSIVQVSAVIVIDITDGEAVQRLANRLVCQQCGATYNRISKPPAREGVCDKCEGTLIRRKDDEPDAIRERLRIYHEETKPLIDRYGARGMVARVNGEQPIVEVHEDIVEALRCLGIAKHKPAAC